MDAQEEKEYDFVFKIIVVGDMGVGKTCLILRFADDKFEENTKTTIGIDFKVLHISMTSDHYDLHILYFHILDSHHLHTK